MKKILLAAALLVSASTGALAQNIGIDIGGSGYYGRIELGDFARPPVIYQQPMIIERVVGYQRMEPMYLRVPPGHAKKWSKHCRAYNACGRQVYFVRDEWYSNTYAPRYRQTHGGRDYNRRDDRRDDWRDDRRDYSDHGKHDKHGKRDKHDKHEGKGKGHGHGNGKH
jgi:hypothetical protein